jgi:hypothetical protein
LSPILISSRSNLLLRGRRGRREGERRKKEEGERRKERGSRKDED